MGEPLPPDFPEFIFDKWYDVGVNAFAGPPPPFQCDIGVPNFLVECKQGISINIWLAAGGDCVAGNELIFFSATSAQRMVRAVGPFDTLMECLIG